MIKTIDTIILGLMMALVLKGIWRGFKKELASLATYGGALLLTMSQLDMGTRILQKQFNLHPVLAYIVAYVVIYLAIFIFLKIMVKNIMKIFQKEPTSGLLDTIGGGVFGFSLAVIIVAVLLITLRPIPVVTAALEDSHNSIFIPVIEKRVEPLVSGFVSSPADKIPLDQLMSQTAGDNMIMPGALKMLLGEGGGDIMKQAEQLKDLVNIKDNAAKIMGQAPSADSLAGAVEGSPDFSSYHKALDVLNIDTKNKKTLDTQDLLKRLKKK